MTERRMDDLGDRMKGYERVETARKLDASLPVYARIDGRSFSTFTRGMRRPFDERLSRLMIDVTRDLVAGTSAVVGYTQSDEISLGWHVDMETNPLADLFFGGKVQKIASVLSGMATSHFMRRLVATEAGFAAYADKAPHFDARIHNVPDRDELANAFLWRELDASRNAIQMVAQDLYPHRALHGAAIATQLSMIRDKGVVFGELPDYFRHGTFVQRRKYEIPRVALVGTPHRRGGDTAIRTEVVARSMPSFRQVANRTEVIFGAEPILRAA